MWHYFITLPPVARMVGLLGVAALAGLGLLKRRAIAAFGGALCNAASERFWGHVHHKLQAAAKPSAPTPQARPANQKTYRGAFQGYNQWENPPRDHFFTLLDGGTTITVPVARTNLLSGVRHGDLVEIDTQIGIFYGVEVVQRVRVLK